ncbi:MAG TPA: MFS transporter [Capsulimonadaceae bacterium]|jgi:GPH family glycoside/pentoside/hexuronide:cation symporter
MSIQATDLPRKPYIAPTRQIWAWGIGALATHALIQTFGQAGTIFTVGFGISPLIIGWAMMIPRLADAFLDPYLGHLSDNTKSRWGRRKPYLIIGAVLGAILLNVVWWANPAWSPTATLIYLGVFGTLFYICYGLYTMAWTAVGYELTDDYNERSKVAAVAAFFLALVALSSAWIYRIALMPIFGHNKIVDGKLVGDEIVGIRWIAAGAAVIIVTAAVIAASNCKERFTHTNRKHEALFPALKTTLQNRPFVILLLIKVCQLLGERLAGALLGFLAIYYVCHSDKTFATEITGIGGTIGLVWNFALLPFLKPISVKFGKRSALICGAAISLAAAAIQPFILNPHYPYLLLIPALILAPLMLIANTLANAVVPDICDVDELATGQRREGLFTSVMGFMAKLEISLCTLLTGYIVVWAGLDVKLVGPQPQHVLDKLYWLAIIPNIIFSLGAFMLTLKFPMTEESMKEVRRQLDERHHAIPESAPDNEAPDADVEPWVQAEADADAVAPVHVAVVGALDEKPKG